MGFTRLAAMLYVTMINLVSGNCVYLCVLFLFYFILFFLPKILKQNKQTNKMTWQVLIVSGMSLMTPKIDTPQTSTPGSYPLGDLIHAALQSKEYLGEASAGTGTLTY